jgi:adenylosuccinate synthase
MSGVVIVGAQFGDEGKGKMTDYLARRADCVVRYQGGNNAGHTVVIGGREFRLHLIPSGIFYPEKVCVIGNGMVIDPEVLFQEMDVLLNQGLKLARLYISDRAHLLLPYHLRLDEAEENYRGADLIGTTRRGIGPAYTDKVARVGFRIGELMEPGWEKRLESLTLEKSRILKQVYNSKGCEPEQVIDWVRSYTERLRPLLMDTSLVLAGLAAQGKHILFEGAQGTMLDIDHGTYPFVTSSSPTAGGACTGAGVGPTAINRVLGVCKAYLTRVGEGLFPTELDGPEGDEIRSRGREFGTTTGRARRCGWIDLVMLRYAARVNGLDGLLITKLDVLDSFPTIRLCNAYTCNGGMIREFPSSQQLLQSCEPVYEDLEGWQQDTSGVRRYEDLPIAARRFIERIGEVAGLPVMAISVGPDREQTIMLQELFPQGADC